MKKTTPANLPTLPHIKGQNMRQLADKAGVKKSYVWMILNGQRDTNSRKAKKILAAAKKMNEAIESGLQKADKILIGEND
ncbi:MAG: helix-turn-helix domain-containing protein [Bacteroidia bacterium]|nr:helix-turn-helix domain-containing protein [Bacteroidia bacterium]